MIKARYFKRNCGGGGCKIVESIVELKSPAEAKLYGLEILNSSEDSGLEYVPRNFYGNIDLPEVNHENYKILCVQGLNSAIKSNFLTSSNYDGKIGRNKFIKEVSLIMKLKMKDDFEEIGEIGVDLRPYYYGFSVDIMPLEINDAVDLNKVTSRIPEKIYEDIKTLVPDITANIEKFAF